MIGREESIEKLNGYLNKNNGFIVLSSESVLESTLFVLSTVRSMPEEQKNKLLSKLIIVKESDVWDEVILKYGRDAIFIPVFCFNENTSCPKLLFIDLVFIL